MTTAPPPVLLVLPEGSRADSLVDVGVAEALRQGTGLHLLRVAGDAADTDPDPEVLLAGLRRRAEDRSDRVAVTSEHLSGDVVRVAVDRSPDARLVIVPHEDRSVVAEEELLGATAVGVVSGSEVPVLVVPQWWEEDEQPRGVVAVGVDEVTEAHPLLAEAARQAVARGARLVVVHADRHRLLHRRRDDEGGDVPDWLRGAFPGLEITMRFVEGTPEQELEHASEEAELVVIGRAAPRRGGARLGRTGHRVLEEAACPVLVVEPGG